VGIREGRDTPLVKPERNDFERLSNKLDEKKGKGMGIYL